MAKGRSYKRGNLEVTVGNTKLGTDTTILNMGSATDCPSAKLGKCKLGNNCYALKAENMYTQCKPYRDRQSDYWLNTPIETIIQDFDTLLRTRRVRRNGKLVRLYETIDYFRFNESGDFYSQEDVEKLDELSTFLFESFSITTYGYTARNDLDYNGISFILKGSGWVGAPNGMTIARKLDITPEQRGLPITFHNDPFMVCPTDCRTCKLCKVGSANIVFELH